MLASPHGGRCCTLPAMSDFAILRIQKLKANVAVQRSMKHAFRTQETPNADPKRLAENSHIGAESIDEAMALFRARLPDKIRKNGVLAVEFLVTASPEVMAKKSRADQDRYFEDALTWLKARHGAENVVYAGIHRDEITPHMYAYVVPLDDQGKLNCRSFYGGAAALSGMQTDFANRVGKRHGLSRGIEGSKARHTTVREFYAGIRAAEKPQPAIPAAFVEPRVTKAGGLLKAAVVETSEQVAERVTKAMHETYASVQAAASGTVVERKKRLQAEATARAKVAEVEALGPLAAAVKDLPPEYFVEVVQQAKALQRLARLAAEASRRVTLLGHRLARSTGSAVDRYARAAIAAIKVAGDHTRVVWDEVDEQWRADATAGRDGQELTDYTVAVTILEHSPSATAIQVNQNPEAREEMLAKAKANQLPEEKPRISGPLGP